MVDNVVKAISAALHAEFGDDCRIYEDNVEHGFERPCFYVLAYNLSSRPITFGRHRRTYDFDVHYFPAGGRPEADAVAGRLFGCLGVIDCGTFKLRGGNMSARHEDGVLHLLVSYSMYVWEPSNHDYMESYTHKTKTKE